LIYGDKFQSKWLFSKPFDLMKIKCLEFVVCLCHPPVLTDCHPWASDNFFSFCNTRVGQHWFVCPDKTTGTVPDTQVTIIKIHNWSLWVWKKRQFLCEAKWFYPVNERKTIQIRRWITAEIDTGAKKTD